MRTWLRCLPAVLTTLAACGAAATMADTTRLAAVSDIIFSHPLHVTDQGIECATCHTAVAASVTAQDRNLPSMDVCGECHDVTDDKKCGQCHKNPDNPSAAIKPKFSVKFNHKFHLEYKITCRDCHTPPDSLTTAPFNPAIPRKPMCMNCHDGVRAGWDCDLCHTGKTTLADIHPVGWRHQHAEQATLKPDWCRTCHQQEVYCVGCHRGDNQTGSIHDLNYRFTHGLDAQGKEADCSRCHDRRAFCDDCHIRENRMPLSHSRLSWKNEHGREAHADIESCASCHEVDDPTCARAGCHLDSDGIRGTDPRIHPSSLSRFDSHGPWHTDDGYFCFACHISTGQPGVGFCGYCHGDKGE